MSNITYVHAGNFKEFQDYQALNTHTECIYIEDDITLRARTPGKIVLIGTYSDKFLNQAIRESIDLHISLWEDQGFFQDEDPSLKIEIDEEGNTLDDYGV